MRVRYANENDKNTAIKHWENSFDDDDNEIKFYFDNIYDNKNYLILEKDGEIISSLYENPYILTINSKKFDTKYIVGVSTPLEEQRKGYMSFLLKTMLKNLKEKNFPFIFLTPINPDIYRKYGFEYFSRIEKYELPIEILKDLNRNEKIFSKEINLENYVNFLDDLIEIYNSSMKYNLSYLKRDKHYFTKLLKECFNENMKVFIQYDDKKTPLSYIIFSKYNSKISVRECKVKEYKHYTNILSILYGYSDYFKKIEIYSQENSNLEMIFKNQLEIKKTIFPFMMLRILNPIQLLNSLNLKIENLKISLNDSILEENNGIYYFDKIENKWTILKKECENYTFKIDITNLVPLLLGFYSLEELIFMNKVEINKDLSLEELLNLKSKFTRKKSYLYEFQ